MADHLEEIALDRLADVTGGILSEDQLSQAYRSAGRLPVTAPASEAYLGKAGLFTPNPYVESLRNSVTTSHVAPSNSGNG